MAGSCAPQAWQIGRHYRRKRERETAPLPVLEFFLGIGKLANLPDAALYTPEPPLEWYVQGNVGLQEGPITLADEQAQWTAGEAELAQNRATIAP